MKKIIILSALLISAICASPVAASWAKQNEIKGKLKSKIPVKDISLMSIVDGEPKVLSSSPIAEDGSFSIIFTADHEGFYAIGAQDMLKGQFPVYLKPGDAAEVNIEDKNIVFTQNNTPENLVLGKWSVLTQDLKSKSVYFTSTRSTYVDFFPELTAVSAQVEGFKKTIQTKNQKFNLVMKTQLGFDLDFYALNMLATPRSAHPAKTDYPAYYSTIVVKNRFPDDQVLNTLYGKRFMAMYVSFAAGQDKTVPEMLSFLNTDRQKGEYILYSQGRYVRSYDRYKAMVDNFGQYFKTENQKKTIAEMAEKLSATKPGGLASDFSYPDQDGKLVSLSDQKGKVVLVDVWATWCGPCKQQIPALKQLEKEMHGKDIVIMSVSVDVEKDKAKWLQMIKDESLGGVQLFASGWSKIAKDYQITGIPRFMVFDKKGNIVSTDAPRPTQPELKALLEAELKK